VGDFGNEDLAEAFSYFRAAVANKDKRWNRRARIGNAAGVLGYASQYGLGVAKNIDEAIKWYKLGVEQDSGFAASSARRYVPLWCGRAGGHGGGAGLVPKSR